MKVSADSADRCFGEEHWRPGGIRWLAWLLARADAFFDRVYSSRFNPLSRTGMLAALLLTAALVSGVYLLFVYELARPYDSMVAIQRDVVLGRWIRALHRYASDAAVVAVALHVARLVVQGKTWGPRMLAWLTGVVLTGMMFLSAITGFVLVWDAFGQKLAVAGARMLRLVPLFVEPPDRAFLGDKAVSPQFFFMNLFLHVAIPLGMICVLWLHTSKLARAGWFPETRIAASVLGGLVIFSVLWPAPLGPAADLLAIPGRVPSDWFYGFWLVVADVSPSAALAAVTLAAAVMLAIPWLVRPRRDERGAPAFADPESCEGCRQCVADCPYDAIEMVAGAHPERYPLRAQVMGDACVSCGLCAGSCASLAIGPERRTAWHQLAAAREVVKSTPGCRAMLVVVGCRNNGDVVSRLRAAYASDARIRCIDVACAGTLHPATVSYLASRFAAVAIASCPPSHCVHREGAALLDARIVHEQRPAVPGRLARQSVRVFHDSAGEWRRLVSAIAAFRDGLGDERVAPSHVGGFVALRVAAALAVSGLLLGLVALGSRAPQGADPRDAVLRLGWRLTGQTKDRCRDVPPEELARRPVHMRTPRECRSDGRTYALEARVDGEVVVRKTVRAAGLRADRPLTVEEDLAVAPGEHHVTVTFVPVDGERGATALTFDRPMRFDRGRVALVTTDGERLVTR